MQVSSRRSALTSFWILLAAATALSPVLLLSGCSTSPVLRTAPPAPLTISTSSLPTGKIGASYSASLVASGGTAPYAWSLASGSLPAGLSLLSNGTISGTPTVAGSFNFSVQVSDSASPAATASSPLAAIINGSLTITTTLPNGTVGVAYAQQLAAAGGKAPYSWTLVAGSLPAGLSLAATGAISGTPTAAGTSTFKVQVADSSSSSQTDDQVLTITIAAAQTPLSIATKSLANATVGVAYSQTLSAAGGTPPYTWSVAAGSSLPSGLTLDAAGGTISGTPAAAAQASFTIQVADSSSPQQMAAKSFTIVIGAAPVPLAITSASLAAGTVGLQYTQTLAASGGTTPYTWSIVQGSLAAGLTMDASGNISGTPTAAGTAGFTVQVADSSVPQQTKTAALGINVNPAPPTLSVATTSLSLGTVAIAYSATLTASGGIQPYTWSLAPNQGLLPDGLSLSAAGTISGTATLAGTFSFTVQVADSSPTPQTATAPLSLTINPAIPPLTITIPTPLANATIGLFYSLSLSASGGTLPYSWTITGGALPGGLSLSSGGSNVISGTPTAVGTATFTAQVTDSSSPPQSQSAQLTLNVVNPTPPALAITTTSLVSGLLGTAYSQVLSATGGTTPYTWSITSGALPAGLSLDPPSGTISGTPTAPGLSNFTATVTDSSSPAQTVSASFGVTIQGASSVTLDCQWPPPSQTDESSSSAPLNLPAASCGGSVAPGDLLVVPIQRSPAGVGVVSITDDEGDAFQQVPGAHASDINGGDSDVFYAVANGTISGSFNVQVTVGSSATFEAASLFQLSGVDPANPVDQVAEVSDQLALAKIVSPTITTQFGNEFILATNTCQWLSSEVLSSLGGTFNFFNYGGCGGAYQIASAAGNYQVTWDQDDGDPSVPYVGTSCSNIVSFKPAGASAQARSRMQFAVGAARNVQVQAAAVVAFRRFFGISTGADAAKPPAAAGPSGASSSNP